LLKNNPLRNAKRCLNPKNRKKNTRTIYRLLSFNATRLNPDLPSKAHTIPFLIALTFNATRFNSDFTKGLYTNPLPHFSSLLSLSLRSTVRTFKTLILRFLFFSFSSAGSVRFCLDFPLGLADCCIIFNLLLLTVLFNSKARVVCDSECLLS
jgi:hypothetical protein